MNHLNSILMGLLERQTRMDALLANPHVARWFRIAESGGLSHTHANGFRGTGDVHTGAVLDALPLESGWSAERNMRRSGQSQGRCR